MLQLKVGPAGVRGKVDQGLDLGLVIDITSAFATWLDRGSVLVARDTRPSSQMLVHAVSSALSAAGREVLDAGICPTAAAQAEAARVDAAGAISVTASHNDATWNGLKLFGNAGRVLTSAEGKEMLDLWHQGEYDKMPYDRLGATRDLEDVIEHYVAFLLDRIDRDTIAAARLRVVVDACNGAGAMAAPELCRQLGVELIPISCEPTGEFPHQPDPTARNLAQVASIMRPVAAHVGFGLSSDCERVSMVTDRGEALGARSTLPLAMEEVLARSGAGADVVVASIASDSRVDQVAESHGARVVRSGVGIQAVMEQVDLNDAVLGGEGSGGVAIVGIHAAFDGLAVLASLLERVAKDGDSHSMAEALPTVHVRAAEIPCPVGAGYAAVSRMRASATGRVTDLDGVRVDGEGGWYYIRVSHTEPVVRVICEDESPARVDERIQLLRRQLTAAVQE
jgi:phosphomannomutase